MQSGETAGPPVLPVAVVSDSTDVMLLHNRMDYRMISDFTLHAEHLRMDDEYPRSSAAAQYIYIVLSYLCLGLCFICPMEPDVRQVLRLECHLTLK